MLMATSPAETYAQKANATQTASRTVKGTVVDKNGEPIIGATVTQVGNSKNGAITDLDGNFTITIPGNRGIKVSYIGYVTQTVNKLSGSTRIVLQEDESSLDEVVVVGYGALKQKNVTGAVEVIDPTELKDLAVSNLSEALIVLIVSAARDSAAKWALEALPRLKRCDVHRAHLPGSGDAAGLRRLGISFTYDPLQPTKKLFP
jgi:hypothetical protein